MSIIDRNLLECKKIRDLCEKEHRNPTNEERAYANKLLAEIDFQESGNFFNRDESHPLANTWHNEDESRTSGKPYELRSAGDKKDFRSLYGDGRNTHEWTDRESTFYEALFSGRHHPGLITRSLSESVPSSGGFLVPVEMSREIHNVAIEDEIILPRCTVQPMTGESIKLPAMEIGNHSSNLYGGFTASWEPELGSLSQANPKFRQMELTANKLTGFVRASNELIADAPGGSKKLNEICGKGLRFYRDDAFFSGSGAGMPLGLFNCGCKIAVEAESGQDSSTIILENLHNMLSRLYAGGYGNSVWLASQSCIPSLLSLSLSIGTGGSAYPVMTETDGKYRMFGREVIFTEHCQALGTEGDICLTDLSQYVAGVREDLRIDLSGHVFFETDELAMRLISRLDGHSLWSEPLTLKDGSTTVSPIITLEDR